MKQAMSFDVLQRKAERQSKKYSFDSLASRFGNPNYTHCYVYGCTARGKWVILGPLSEPQAVEAGEALTDAEVFYLSTPDIAKATQEIKAELWRRGVDPDEAISRKGHKEPPSLQKEEKRKRSLGWRLFHNRHKTP